MVEQDLAAQIRLLAFHLWELEGRPEGRERIHWVRAEAEVREKMQPSHAFAPRKLHRIVVSNDKIPPVFRTTMRWQNTAQIVAKA
jgi:hypothetical protein